MGAGDGPPVPHETWQQNVVRPVSAVQRAASQPPPSGYSAFFYLRVALGSAFVPYYILHVSLLRVIHARFRRDQPARWRLTAGHDARSDTAPHPAHILEYQLCCCDLAAKMHVAFTGDEGRSIDSRGCCGLCCILPEDEEGADVEANVAAMQRDMQRRAVVIRTAAFVDMHAV